eukprot:3351571-Amphidinium_carterae.1
MSQYSAKNMISSTPSHYSKNGSSFPKKQNESKQTNEDRHKTSDFLTKRVERIDPKKIIYSIGLVRGHLTMKPCER